MGGFATGLMGEIGKQIQQHHERNVAIQHQGYEEQAQQYDQMAKRAEDSGNDQLAADLHKASFSIRTTMPGSKPKKINNPDGTTLDPLDMQGIIAKHTRLAAERNANAPAPVQPLSPNGSTPQMPQQLAAPPSANTPVNNLPGGPTIQNAQRGGNLADFYNR